MTTNELLKIKDLIKKSELESAKAEGQIESIKKEWKEKYGFDSINKAEMKLEELKQELENSNNRLNKLYKELEESQDWDKLEEELN
jgi:hypothetical protein